METKLQEMVIKEKENREKIQELIDERDKLKVSEREHARKYEELTGKTAECASKLVGAEKRVIELSEENNRLRKENERLSEHQSTPKKGIWQFILDLFR